MAVDMVHFILRGVMIIVVSMVGVVGNVLTLVVMRRRSMRSSINCLLMGMVVCDIIFLITYMLVYGFRVVLPLDPSTGSRMLFYYQYYVFPYIVHYLYPTGKAAQAMSVYLTVGVTLERWVAVTFPLRAKSLCTYARTRWCVIGIAIFSLAYCIPRYLEYDIEKSQVNNETVYNAVFNEFATAPYYHLVYRHWVYTIVMYIVPFTTLAIFNALIVWQLWRARAKREEMSGVQRRENRLAIMLLVIVIVFFACNLLPLIRNKLYISGVLGGKEALIYTSDLLLTVNHAVNFIIYAIFSENFRKAFMETYCTCKKRRPVSFDRQKSATDSNISINTVSTSTTGRSVDSSGL